MATVYNRYSGGGGYTQTERPQQLNTLGGPAKPMVPDLPGTTNTGYKPPNYVGSTPTVRLPELPGTTNTAQRYQQWQLANPSPLAGTAAPDSMSRLTGQGYDHAPAAGPGAGRSYPSNWNTNNAPGYNYQNAAFPSGPGGATYETSPLYQWQLNQGEKNINRELAARGRYNSTMGVNTLADFYRGLAAQEAERQYGRTVEQQQLGMQAAMAQAAQQQNLANLYSGYGNTLGGLSSNFGNYLSGLNVNQGLANANLTGQYVRDLNGNIINLGQLQAQNAWNLGNPLATNALMGGANRADLYAGLGHFGAQALNMPWFQGQQQTNQPIWTGGVPISTPPYVSVPYTGQFNPFEAPTYNALNSSYVPTSLWLNNQPSGYASGNVMSGG